MRLGAIVLGLALLGGVAEANPWSKGVTEAQKATAQRALEEGNLLFLEKRYTDALAKYESAVTAWNHPAIRFNIVRCQILLDRVFEAADNLKLALAYGAAPLEKDVFQEALTYEKLLADQIGEVAVTCSQSGVRITLDGQTLTGCPGQAQRKVKPGAHQIVGVSNDLLTKTVDVVVVGGTTQTLEMKLDAPGAATTRIEHRWATWMPWVVFGSGLAVGGFGVVLNVIARSDMNRYQRQVADFCNPTPCTDDDADLEHSLKDRAELEGSISLGLLVAGGATAVTGAVLLYLNRGRTVSTTERITPSFTATAGGAAVSIHGAF